jgi:hypothetical protein
MVECHLLFAMLCTIQVKRIGAIELMPVRSFFSSALSQMYDISGAQARAQEAALRNSYSAANNSSSSNAADANKPQQASRLRRFRN